MPFLERFQSNWVWFKEWVSMIGFAIFILIGLGVVFAIDFISNLTAAILITFVYKYQTEVAFRLLLDEEFCEFLEDSGRFGWKKFEFAHFHTGFICFRRKRDVTFLMIKWPEHVRPVEHTWKEIF